MNIKITERDNKIFDILFRLRYATPKQLSIYLDVPTKSIYDRVEKLVKAKYIESIKLPNYFNNRVYANGINIRRYQERTNYRNKVNINSWSLLHHLKINDTFLHFVKYFNIDEVDITTEREMYWKRLGLLDKGSKNYKDKLIVPDLVIQKGKRLISIEVEESQKNKLLMRDVFKNYANYTKYYCVRYICPTKPIKTYINNVAKEERRTFIKAFTYDEFKDGLDIIGF